MNVRRSPELSGHRYANIIPDPSSYGISRLSLSGSEVLRCHSVPLAVICSRKLVQWRWHLSEAPGTQLSILSSHSDLNNMDWEKWKQKETPNTHAPLQGASYVFLNKHLWMKVLRILYIYNYKYILHKKQYQNYTYIYIYTGLWPLSVICLSTCLSEMAFIYSLLILKTNSWGEQYYQQSHFISQTEKINALWHCTCGI